MTTGKKMTKVRLRPQRQSLTFLHMRGGWNSSGKWECCDCIQQCTNATCRGVCKRGEDTRSGPALLSHTTAKHGSRSYAEWPLGFKVLKSTNSHLKKKKNALGKHIYLRLEASDTELPTWLGGALLLEVRTLVLSYSFHKYTTFWFAV